MQCFTRVWVRVSLSTSTPYRTQHQLIKLRRSVQNSKAETAQSVNPGVQWDAGLSRSATGCNGLHGIAMDWRIDGLPFPPCIPVIHCYACSNGMMNPHDPHACLPDRRHRIDEWVVRTIYGNYSHADGEHVLDVACHDERPSRISRFFVPHFSTNDRYERKNIHWVDSWKDILCRVSTDAVTTLRQRLESTLSMAAAMDGTNAVADPENRVTLRDPIRESEGLCHSWLIVQLTGIFIRSFRTSQSSSYQTAERSLQCLRSRIEQHHSFDRVRHGGSISRTCANRRRTTRYS